MRTSIRTDRLALRRLETSDTPAVAAIIGDPLVAICVMCDTSTPERCRNEAARRIDWFNRYWESGYGVLGVTIADSTVGPEGALIGWCGVAGFEGSQGEPELLYGLSREYWGAGLVTEAALATAAEYFDDGAHTGLCAIIFEQLNRGSVRVAEKVGLVRERDIPFADFAPDVALRQTALDFALWCISSPARDDPSLMVQAAAKAGLVVGSGVGDPDEVLAAIREAGTNSDAAERAFENTRGDPACPYLRMPRPQRTG